VNKVEQPLQTTKSAQNSEGVEAAALIEEIAAGDQSALTTLYDRTGHLVSGLLLRVLGDPSVVEEVLLDVYTQVWRQASGYDPKLASALAWLRAIAGTCAIARIGMIPAEGELPDYLRDLLAARVERESEAKPPQALLAKAEKVDIESKRPAAPSRSPVFAPPPQERSHLPWLVAAALAVVGGLAFFAWRQADEATKHLNAQLAAAQADITNLRTLVDMRAGATRELEQINAAISSRGAKLIHLQGQAAAPSASIAIFWDTQRNRWLIIGYLPPTPEGKVYQLWFMMPKENVSAGVMQPDSLGRIFTAIDITQDLSKLSGAAMTLEPQGGSKQPTPPFCAVSKVS
jgi:anti-sigma-K factor RskA